MLSMSEEMDVSLNNNYIAHGGGGGGGECAYSQFMNI